jgi:hypothetical protein
MAVRLGFIADVQRPPPPGAASERQAPRIPTRLRVRIGDVWRQFSGDVSVGGALLLAADPLPGPTLELSLSPSNAERTWRMTAELLRREMRGGRVAHHLLFVDSSQVDGLDALIRRTLAEGRIRLDPQ